MITLRSMASRLVQPKSLLNGLLAGAVTSGLLILITHSSYGIAELIYDYQIFLTGVAAIVAAIAGTRIGYKRITRKISADAETEEYSRKRQAFTLDWELYEMTMVVLDTAMSDELLIASSRKSGSHKQSIKEVTSVFKTLGNIHHKVPWRDLAVATPPIIAHTNYLTIALSQCRKLSSHYARILPTSPDAALAALETVKVHAGVLERLLSEDLEELGKGLGVTEIRRRLASAAIMRHEAEEASGQV